MRGYLNHLAAAAAAIVLGASVVAAKDTQETTTQEKSSGNPRPWYSPARYNPLKLIKHYKSANDQLASDGHLEDKLSKQLRIQRLLGENEELQVVCSDFRDLANCIAVVRVSHSLPVEFTCLKWNVTGVKPKPVADSCAGPAGGKAMPLDRALDLLKPNLDVRTESRNALKKAHDDIKDASA